MDMTTHRARITGPLAYVAGTGQKRTIPVGPCLVEHIGGQSVDIIWGAQGQRCAVLHAKEIEAARNHGHLVLLD